MAQGQPELLVAMCRNEKRGVQRGLYEWRWENPCGEGGIFLNGSDKDYYPEYPTFYGWMIDGYCADYTEVRWRPLKNVNPAFGLLLRKVCYDCYPPPKYGKDTGIALRTWLHLKDWVADFFMEWIEKHYG